MNKAELITAVSEKTGLSKKDSEKAVNAALDTITETLEIGEKLDGFITNANRVQSGSAFKWGAQGYGIYASDDTLIVAVTVKAYDADGTDVTATVIGADGGMLVAGTYKIEYDLTYNGVNQKFFHNVAVNAPAAEA